MLPLVIDEQQIFIFKFWFNDKVHHGMHYQNELFCRIATSTLQMRPHIYQLSCKLTQNSIPLAISCTDQTCSLWGSLRNETIKRFLMRSDNINLANLSDIQNLSTLLSEPQSPA